MLINKLWSEMNRTTLGVGHFKTVSGHFFASCINSFHKTEDLTVILRGPTLFFNILIWSKRSFFASSLLLVFCNFVRKKKENLWLTNGHFITISGHFFANYIKIFHKTEIQTVILRCLVCLNPNLDQKLWYRNTEVSFYTLEEKQLSHFQYGCFIKILW